MLACPSGFQYSSQPARAVWIEIKVINTTGTVEESQPARAVWIEIGTEEPAGGER